MELASSLLVAAMLVFAGASKLGNIRRFRVTLQQLHLSANRLPELICLIEISLGVAVVLAPYRAAVGGMVWVAGFAFAGAGLWTRLRGLKVMCSCFGRSDGAYLGLKQVYVLPLWIAAGALIERWSPPTGYSERLAILAASSHVAVVMALVGVASHYRNSHAIRAATRAHPHVQLTK